MAKSALIAGATGLVGKSLLEQLLADRYYDTITVLARRHVSVGDERVKLIVADFDELYEYSGQQISANHYFCCLGTTMKKAGSKEAFYKVDYTYPLELAKIAQHDPAFEQFHVVSAAGANPNSVIYYNNVKGQLEEGLKTLGLRSLHIYRPSLLLGKREEFRFFEAAAQAFTKFLSFFMVGSGGRKLFAIEASRVAKAMLLMGRNGADGAHVYTATTIQKMTNLS